MTNVLSDDTVSQDNWRQQAISVRDFCTAHAAALDAVIPGFAQPLAKAFSKIRRFEFGYVENEAAFYFDDETGTITISHSHIDGLIKSIRTEFATHQLRPEYASVFGLHTLEELERLAVRGFIVHEVAHFAQGFSKREDVQKLKNIRAHDIIGAIDLRADCIGAKVCAAIRMAEAGDATIEGYLRAFAEGLYFLGLYCFPAFGVPMSKPWKVERALGITMMLARIAAAERQGMLLKFHESGLPLDTVLMPNLGEGDKGIAVMIMSGEPVLLVVDDTVGDQVQAICEMLSREPFDEVIDVVIGLVRQLKIG